MFDFTNRVKKIINEYAPREAKRLGHEYLGPEHILLGIIRASDSIAIKILQNLNVETNELRKEIEKRCEQDASTLLVEPGAKDRIQRILEYSRDEARKMRHSYVGSEHILMAILRDSTSIAAASLASFSVTYQVIRNELNQTLGLPQTGPGNFRTQPSSKKENLKTPMLEEYARNLSRMAIDKVIDPIIGRDKEIERVIQVLSRKTKNNPILIGEAGVGKTAIVEGLAQRIIEKKTPEILYDRIVYALDVAALIAGTKYRGEFEDRIKKIMKEVKTNKNVILFIDEVHTIIGAGAAEGAVDAANILKPALARGEVQCIGATTLKEYKKYIERDSALERRFQNVMVEEPSVDDTIRILSGLRKSYEKHHSVVYSKEAIKASVRMSNRFVTDRYLPDKAIDLIDESGARARLLSSVIPEDIKQKEQELIKLNRKKNEMVRVQEYEKAARLRDSIEKLKEKIRESTENWRVKQKEKTIVISEEDISAIISDWTGIPLKQLQATESEKLLKMEEELSYQVVGQNEAIDIISKAVRRSRTGFKVQKRPIGSFIFLGPSGVGKTQLAKALAEFMFGDESLLVRFDMSEYMEMHSVSKFIGSPPGYVGYEEGGLLTESVKRKPYSILLFDEIEKAHPEIQNILLQILDEGELTDNMGNHVDFKETIIIMTSNLGARRLQKGGRLGFDEGDDKEKSKKDQVIEDLKKHFNPEFINRIDEIIIFNSLKSEDILEIIEIIADEINEQILQKDLYINFKKAAKQYLIDKGYDEKTGVRPLRRVIQKEIEDELANMVLEGRLKAPAEITIDMNAENKLEFKKRKITKEKLEKYKKEYLVEDKSIEDYWDNEESEENLPQNEDQLSDNWHEMAST
ncbi:MAG: ATP-dependent Clp protease ATP-binding subunit [Spirochaetia bacterium]|nr:ATP-dependent Clp protease ATP-binding subunit [Spirochaetia bacterium]